MYALVNTRERKAKKKLLMNVSKSISYRIFFHRQEKEKLMLPTHNCDLPRKEKREKGKTDIRNEKDVSVEDHSSLETKDKRDIFLF